jgi:hypothetical protein
LLADALSYVQRQSESPDAFTIDLVEVIRGDSYLHTSAALLDTPQSGDNNWNYRGLDLCLSD